MGTSLQLLVVSQVFPPDAQVGGKRVVGLCRYLPAHHVQPIVLTLQERFSEECDDSYPIPSEIEVERTGEMFDPLDVWRKAKPILGFGKKPKSQHALAKGICEIRAGTHKSFFRYQAEVLLDSYYLCGRWHVAPVRAGANLLEQRRIAAIFSSGPPWSSHLVALRLKRRYGLPWIADFRDSWTFDPWRAKGLPRWREVMDHKLEESCVRCADLVVSVTNPMREGFIRNYPDFPDSKFVVLPNGFDDDCLPKILHDSTNILVASDYVYQWPSRRLLLHLGDLYQRRRIDTFCQALANLVESGQLDSNGVRILFQGNVDPSITIAVERDIQKLRQEGCIEFRPRVPWQEGQSLLKAADVLLIFQGDHHTAIPAKFYEYLRTGKPILAVVQESALSEIIESTKSGVWADPNSPAEIASGILEALRLPVRGLEEVDRYAGEYHYRSLSAKLAEWVRRLVCERSRFLEGANNPI